MSYYHADTGKYGIGSDDGYFIAFFIVLLTGLRAVTMEYMFAPLAKRWGISKKKEVTRFSEQAWNIVWYGGSSALGVVSSALQSAGMACLCPHSALC